MRPRQRATELLLRPRRSLHLPCVRVRDDPGSSPEQAGGQGVLAMTAEPERPPAGNTDGGRSPHRCTLTTQENQMSTG